jgi:DNA ligase D-like protein (predicted 3'-phosphoesterase)
LTEKDSLAAYRAKRHFARTPEPGGLKKLAKAKQPIFVVQKHQARSLHYDFRLEVDGVLKSWAVPKGPPTNPSEKRLAVPTEDHPLEYSVFSGTIPEGEYGAGTVGIWDKGTFRVLPNKDGEEIPAGQAIAAGHIAFWLEGQKLKGGFALTRTGFGKGGWLLVKMVDQPERQ